MLPSTPFEVMKGQMSSIAKLRAAGSSVELSAEEDAQARAAIIAVQKEMDDADEPSFLEEEDMYVFDREPLTDELNLVSCNMCKKPIKDSQFAAHAERCRSLNTQDDSTLDIDGGAGHKKPPRKARMKLTSQDNDIGAGDMERFPSAEDDDIQENAGVSGGTYEDQPPVYSSNPRGTKKVMNISEGTVVAAPKVGRPRKSLVVAPGDAGVASVGATHSEVVQPLPKRPKLLTTEELDTLCGVLIPQTGIMCRRSITCKLHSETSKRAVSGRRRPYDVLLREFKANKLAAASQNTVAVANPLPLATKEYCHRPDHCMRAVLGSLFSDACSRRAGNRGNSPDRLSGELGGQVLPALTLPADQSSDLQTCQLSGFNQKKSADQRDKDDKNAAPVQAIQMGRVKAEPGLNPAVEYARLNMTSMGLSGVPNYQHLDNRLGMAGVPVDYQHLVMTKGRPVQGLPVLGTNVHGTSHAW